MHYGHFALFYQPIDLKVKKIVTATKHSTTQCTKARNDELNTIRLVRIKANSIYMSI